MTYQFKCDACGNQQEVIRSMKDDSEILCSCCQNVMSQVYKSIGIIYKGRGFYSTDYRKGK